MASPHAKVRVRGGVDGESGLAPGSGPRNEEGDGREDERPKNDEFPIGRPFDAGEGPPTLLRRTGAGKWEDEQTGCNARAGREAAGPGDSRGGGFRAGS